MANRVKDKARIEHHSRPPWVDQPTAGTPTLTTDTRWWRGDLVRCSHQPDANACLWRTTVAPSIRENRKSGPTAKPIALLQYPRQARGRLGSNHRAHPKQVNARAIAIQKQQCGQGGIPGGRCYVAAHGEMREKRLNLWRTDVFRMAFVMRQDKALDSMRALCFRASYVVRQSLSRGPDPAA